MSVISKLVNGSLFSSIFLFLIIFILLFFSAYIGKFCFKKRHGDNALIDDEAKIILGAILSLLALFIGFVLSISINGYDSRQKTEENEAIAIGNAFQYTKLLSTDNQKKSTPLLREYLNARIDFYISGIGKENNQWRITSLQTQSKLWKIITDEANRSENVIDTSILSAYSELLATQQKTMASWQHQIPNAAWVLLIFFAGCSNILIGYNIRGLKGKNWLIIILPLLITLSLVMIAEIDTPGEGIIHTVPDNLVLLKNNII